MKKSLLLNASGFAIAGWFRKFSTRSTRTRLEKIPDPPYRLERLAPVVSADGAAFAEIKIQPNEPQDHHADLMGDKGSSVPRRSSRQVSASSKENRNVENEVVRH